MENSLRRWMVGKQPADDRANVIWNALGSGIYALASMILTYLTIRIIGEKDGGIFAIALTISQMLVYFAYFEMRTYQVTDSTNAFPFCDYYTTKLVACFNMLLVSVVYIALKKYDFEKSVIVFFVCLYRMADGLADVFEAQFHKDNRLDIAGKSMTFRTLFSVAVYFAVLIFTNNLMIAMICAVCAAFLGVWLFDYYVYHAFGSIRITKNRGTVKKILKECFPLFVGTFLWAYILSASRLAIDSCMTSEYQSYYQVLFMPVSVVNLFAGFVFRPMLLTLTEYYSTGNIKKFLRIIGKNIGIVVAFTAVCMAAAFAVGPEVLSFLVNCDLTVYRGVLVFLLFSGGFNAIAFVLYYVLSIMRNGKGIIIGYSIAAIMAYLLSPWMVTSWGIAGAAWSYFLVIFTLNILFLGIIVFGLSKKKSSDRMQNDEEDV